jgi:hypothetical protein
MVVPPTMTFGEQGREPPKARNLPPGGLDLAGCPGEERIPKLAKVLGADEDELLLLAENVPDEIRRRVVQRPDALGKLARLDDEALDRPPAPVVW